jgi:cellulose synthase/poly-beta-1,6-N-acetylglucosamine synthase-like glycosyltransferase
MAEIAFWTCLAWVVYVYAGYPLLAFIVARLFRRELRQAEFEPSVTVLIAAFNEEREIEATILNKLSQDYPADRLSVVVVSDGSTDRTDAIVQDLAARFGDRCRLLRQEPRQGKTQALNMAIASVQSEIVVFSDANSMYAPDALRRLVATFSDPSVGYVTGRMVYTNPGGTGVGEGSGAYMRYENWLRGVESRLNSVVGVDGGIDAVRRSLYVPMRPDQLPDFVLPLNVVEQGRRVVYQENAVLYEPALASADAEMQMRIRVSLRALWALWEKSALLNPFRFPVFAWQLLSHKVLRYTAFVPLIGALLFNMSLAAGSALYSFLLIAQVSLYILAFAGHMLKRSSAAVSKLLIPYYFVILNLACLIAFWKFINGQKVVVWRPRMGG